GEIRPFGDGAERGGVGSAGAALMAHHGRRFRDPAAVWWARQTRESTTGSDPMISLVTEDDVRPEISADVPQAAVFRGVGWAGLHSAVHNPAEDTFLLFKSSPYGSVSHSHADQNSFAILKGGKALAIPSGHYGPAYGMPHHAEWTRQTKANNAVLVDGEGQVVRSAAAQGRIVDFRHQNAITYVAGDATAAYGGKLRRFTRHVLFLRPGVFLVVDQLEAPQPAHFQWLLHAFEKIETQPGRIQSTRDGAFLTVRLACDHNLEYSQTDRFDTPFNQGNPAAYQRNVANHWHFTASTERASRRAVISAVMLVKGPGEKLESVWSPNRIEIKTPDGEGAAWVDAAWNVHLHARWKPSRGEVEEFSLAV
ncbi:MAG: hypothetical protein GY953_19465, partial [bacterium]|nr:hypothetical protein [bacterium]